MNKIPARNFWLALGFQILLLASVPAKALYTLNNGTTVFFQTAPVDPVDLLRGYYQTLGYEISNVNTLAKLPGSELKQNLPNGQEVFVRLTLPPAGKTPGCSTNHGCFEISQPHPSQYGHFTGDHRIQSS
jgi:uncharacterized membrane-anchored protein